MPKLKLLGLTKFDVLDGTPNLNCKVELMLDADLFDFTVPGFEAWQATHCVEFASFCIKQVSQFHDPSGFLNLSPNPLVDVWFALLDSPRELGLGVLQQGQVVTELLFRTRHPGHSQESLLGLNLFIISLLDVVPCIAMLSISSVPDFCEDDSATVSAFFGLVFMGVGDLGDLFII